MKTTLNQAAKVLDVHQRTILRALTKKKNAYWSEGYNPTFDVSAIAKGFKCDVELLEAVFRGDDRVIDSDTAARMLRIVPRAFRYRHITPFIKHGGVVRFLKCAILLEPSA